MVPLQVTDTASTIFVVCDGFSFQVNKTSEWSFASMANLANQSILVPQCTLRTTEPFVYYLYKDTARETDLLVNTPGLVVVRIKGTMYRTLLTDELAGLNFVELHFYVFSDRVVFRKHFNCTGTPPVLSSSTGHCIGFETSGARTTNEVNKWGDDTTEYEPGGYATVDADDFYNYVGFTSDEVNSICIPIEGKDVSGYNFRYDGNGAPVERLNDITMAVGDTIISCVYLVDTVERAGSAKLFDNATDRLALGNAKNDTVWPAPDSGDWISDLNLLPSIGSSGFAQDGIWHIAPDSNDEAMVTIDRTRLGPALRIHDWSFHTGGVGSPVDHLLCYLALNENAASEVLSDETANGEDATWRNVADDTARNTNTAGDSVQTISKGRNLDQQDGAGYIKMTVGVGTSHDNAFYKKGSFMVKVIPQFGYGAGSQTLMAVVIDNSDDYLLLYYNTSGNYFELRAVVDGYTESVFSAEYTTDDKLQRAMVFLCSWDLDAGRLQFALDGQVIGTHYFSRAVPTSQPIEFYVGAFNSQILPGDFVFDEIKTFDECILPYGAFFIGNGAGLLADIDIPHSSLSWYFDGQAALAKGGADLGTSKNPTNTGGQFAATDAILGTNCWDSDGVANVLTVADASEDIIDYSEGSLGIWFNLQTAVSGGEYLFDVSDGDGSDRIRLVFDASGNIDVGYRSASTDVTIYGDIAISVGEWHYLKIAWKDTEKVWCWIDGKENGAAATINDVWGGGDTLTLHFSEDYQNGNGCDVLIQKISTSKSCATPEIWTAMGKPRHMPLIDKG